MKEFADCTDTVLMLRPDHFGFNESTEATNVFQTRVEHLTNEEIHERGLAEFEQFRSLLSGAGVNVLVFDDTGDPHTPDAIFPNNWFSTHQEGTLVLYPMEGENRRHERRNDIVRWLQLNYGFHRILDLTHYELQERFLEGTGSMVLDRVHGTVYACVSTRTDATVINEFAAALSLQRVTTFAADVKTNEETGFSAFHPIYHTNVMMALGSSIAVICAETIRDEKERGRVMSSLWNTGHEVIEISTAQLNRFAGNMLQLKTRHGERLWVMSTKAAQSLTPHQHNRLTSNGSTILHSSLDTIELVGGGSARCMLAEIFHPSLR